MPRKKQEAPHGSMIHIRLVMPVSWSINDAIAFIVSGGSVGPSEIAYTRGLDGVSPNIVTDEQ